MTSLSAATSGVRRAHGMLRTAARLLAHAGDVLRRVIGVPDYERYVAHLRAAHPDLTPLAPDAFARDALARRYDRPGSRCC